MNCSQCLNRLEECTCFDAAESADDDKGDLIDFHEVDYMSFYKAQKDLEWERS